jgi:hypothetical protein
MAGVGRTVAQRQHRAAVEVENQPTDLVDGGHPQRGEPCRRPARLGRVLFERDHLAAGEQGVADDGEPVEGQTAVEEVGLHPLRRERRLPDGDVADQLRVRERGGRSGDRNGEVGVQRQPQPVADDRLVYRRRARRQGHRRRPVECLADHELVEVGAAGFVAAHRHSLPYEYFAISSCLYNLPVSVRGNCASNEIERGHL